LFIVSGFSKVFKGLKVFEDFKDMGDEVNASEDATRCGAKPRNAKKACPK
jgi:hypothetical protein